MRRSTPSASSLAPLNSMLEPDEPSTPPPESISAPSSTAKKTPTAKKSSAPESQTDSLTMHPSGLMCRTSPQKAIAVMLEQLSAVSPVKGSPTPAEALASRMRDICSVTLSESLMKLECPHCFSKTCQVSSHPMKMWTTGQATLFGMHQQETYSDSFPKAGLMRDGQIWGLKTLVLPTEDIGGGVSRGAPFPTPNAFDSVDDFGDRKASNRDEGGMHCFSLRHLVDWQTPSSGNFRTRGGDRADELGLDNEVKQWQKPRMVPIRKGDQLRQETSQEYWERMSSRPDLDGPTGIAWPTPQRADENVDRRSNMEEYAARNEEEGKHYSSLPIAVRSEAWATPQEHDKATGNADRVGRFGTDAGGCNLTDEVVHPTNWSTPKVVTGDYTRDGGQKGEERLTLSGEVSAWSTPRAADGPHGGPNMRDSSGSVALPAQVLTADNWNTPLASDSTARGFQDNGKMGEPIHHQVGRWATPKATPSGADFAREGREGSGGDDLETQLRKQQWATPIDSDYKGSVTLEKAEERAVASPRGVRLPEQVTLVEGDTGRKMQRLNPDWEELLMSWPVGWTDITKPCAGIFPGFPAGQGTFQYPYEPSRTIHRDDSPNRTKRVSAIGNGVCTNCVDVAYFLLLAEPIR